ncbi:MAG: adenylosuccinate lyase [Phycisphaeraceae bacterium]|nr:adenylosuccinate lyase [Phycisphaeraceae bacterium]
MAAPDRTYQSPLETRNASRAMREIWSAHRRAVTWRTIWIALAESEQELGLPISREAIESMHAAKESIDFDAVAAHEARLRHDVMAHVHAFGDAAPPARGVIHLGATSQDVVCNADILILRKALDLTALKLARLIDRAATQAARWRALPALGLTHLQPAQPVTVGKRLALWAQDAAVALAEVEARRDGLLLRGLRGATGTQASYLGLFDGDASKVEALEAAFIKRLGWPEGRSWRLCGQTYPRVEDVRILSSLATAAAAIHKCASDLRLLAAFKEVEEPFEREQIGSSAMPYKRNPMRCERATGLARFVMSLHHSALDTAATQWMERSLDDSSNRRLTLPESFLALDGALDLMINVLGGLIVNERIVASRLAAELPFLATEEIMLAAAREGVDRQDAHEAIRRHSMAAAARVKGEGLDNDLLSRLAADPLFSKVNLDRALDPGRFTGRCAEQVDRFIVEAVEPIRARYGGRWPQEPDLRV